MFDVDKPHRKFENFCFLPTSYKPFPGSGKPQEEKQKLIKEAADEDALTRMALTRAPKSNLIVIQPATVQIPSSTIVQILCKWWPCLFTGRSLVTTSPRNVLAPSPHPKTLWLVCQGHWKLVLDSALSYCVARNDTWLFQLERTREFSGNVQIDLHLTSTSVRLKWKTAQPQAHASGRA